MAWIYYQSTGELWNQGKLIGTGYSGNLTNKNNPTASTLRAWGQFPAERITLVAIQTQKGQ